MRRAADIKIVANIHIKAIINKVMPKFNNSTCSMPQAVLTSHTVLLTKKSNIASLVQTSNDGCDIEDHCSLSPHASILVPAADCNIW